MARTNSAIQKQITDYLQTNYGQVGQIFYYYFNDKNNNPLTPSQTSFIGVLITVASFAIQFFEQILDAYKVALEAVIDSAPVHNEAWISQKVSEFQYSSTNPQVIVLNNFVPSYPVVDPSLRIISRKSVVTDTNKIVNIKVATGSNPAPLSAPQITSLDAYLDAILAAGIQPNVISLVSDKLYVLAQVFFNGQYASTIQADVITALNNYLASIPFDGVVKISSIEDTIQAVPGVTDVIINQVKARDDNTIFANAFVVTKEWDTVAGYIVQETTGGATFADTLTFTVDNK